LRRYWHMRYTMAKGKDGRSLTSSVTHTPYLHRHPYANTAASRLLTTAVSVRHDASGDRHIVQIVAVAWG